MEVNEKQFRKRNAILACLRSSKAHPSAETIYQSLQKEHSDISMATVYRNLALFRQQGLIVSLGTVNGIERFDGRIDPHIHFSCTHCGAVIDADELFLPEQIAKDAEKELGCHVESANLMLRGICKACLSTS